MSTHHQHTEVGGDFNTSLVSLPKDFKAVDPNNVEQFSSTSYYYPYISIPDSVELSEGVWKVMSKLVVLSKSDGDKLTALYVESKGDQYQVGFLHPAGIKALHKLLGTNFDQLHGFLDESTRITPFLILALS